MSTEPSPTEIEQHRDAMSDLARHVFERRDSAPLVVGIGGSVAVGKSTSAELLAERLRSLDATLVVEVVATDGFLLPNVRLDELGLTFEKGSPSTYDLGALAAFVDAVRRRDPATRVPVYSHVTYDVGDDERLVGPVDVVILEGLNVVTVDRGVTELLDLAIYLRADPAHVEEWFVDRFLQLRDEAADDPGSFFHQFVDLDDPTADTIARWTWREMNQPVFERHVEAAASSADVIVHKGADHSVTEVRFSRR